MSQAFSPINHVINTEDHGVPEVDIRGKYAEEAGRALARSIDSAFMAELWSQEILEAYKSNLVLGQSMMKVQQDENKIKMDVLYSVNITTGS